MEYVETVVGKREMKGPNPEIRHFDFSEMADYSKSERPPLPRNQILTSVGNRVQATPYVVVFNNGMRLESVSSGSVSLKEKRSGGSGAQQWHEDLTADVTLYPRPSLFPSPASITKPAEPAGIVKEAETKALANLRRGYFSAPMFAKEAKANIRMIRKRTIGLLEQGINAQRRALHMWEKYPRSRTARNIASLHLEYLFGWTPLIRDVEGMVKYLSRSKSLRVTGRGRATRTSTVSLPGFKLNPTTRTIRCRYKETTGWTTINARESGVRTSVMEDRISCRSSLTVDFDTSFGKEFKNTGMNPVDFAFDAVPLSFLLNFSTNIQDYLAALSPRASGKFVTGCSTLYSRRKFKHQITGLYEARIPQGEAKWITAPPMRASVIQDGVYIDRTVLSVEPEPELVIRNMMDVARYATGASLAISLKSDELRRLIRKRAFYTSKFK